MLIKLFNSYLIFTPNKMCNSFGLSSIEKQLEGLCPDLTNTHKKSPLEPRINVLNKLNEIINDEILFKNYEALLVEKMLPIMIQRLDDKPKVTEIATTVCINLINKLSIQAFPYVCEILFVGLQVETKWKLKYGCLRLLKEYIGRVDKYDKDLLSVSLPNIIPVLRDIVHDTKPEVSELCEEVLTCAMRGITNNDLEPFVGDLIKSITNPEETPETIQKLGGVVFVQTMEGSALSVIVPLMTRGLRTGNVVSKRMCARIISNMTKLLENAVEALPFLSDLMPALKDAIDTIPDPEARNVATQTHSSLEGIFTKGTKEHETLIFRSHGDINTELKNNHSMAGLNPSVLNYISNIVYSLYLTKTTETQEYINELKPYFNVIGIETVPIEFVNKIIDILNTSNKEEGDEDLEQGKELCNCEFTLAYGTKVLLHNTKLRLFEGKKYGLLGQNDCGKTTLMRAIAEGTIDNFPDDINTVFVEADIQGELSHLSCVEYVLASEAIKAMNAKEQDVRDMLKKVGFSEGKSSGSGGDCDDNISSLSGGWRMKLALARAMLQKADILLMDEPTNHLDVKNVKWVKNYINGLKNTTVVMVSHDSGLLNDCCDYILQIDKLKLNLHKGNLIEFAKIHPEEANSYFEFKSNKFKFTFPQPCFLEGVKSRGKVLLKMDNVSLVYPGNSAPTIQDISVRASMASRVACVGVNGAGKSTMIKVLTGELEPTTGSVWKYPNSRVGYIAQHAFHHIENHLEKTPNEYIRWRYEFGDDREGLDKATMKLSETDEEELAKPIEISFKRENGQVAKEKRVISKCTGQRRESKERKKVYEYEISWKDRSQDSNSWYTEEQLLKFSKIYTKILRIIDMKIANREMVAARPLTNENVEKHLNNIGLEPEYASHYRIGALSGGQKVKVVLAAAMWDQPHILILDEPTNYLDRDSLGALADAINIYEGGIIMITHNDEFCRQLCPERWVLEAGRLNTEGDIEWMTKASNQEIGFTQIEEMVDASGNEVKIKRRKKLNAKEKKKKMALIKRKIEENDDLDSEEEEYAIEWNL